MERDYRYAKCVCCGRRIVALVHEVAPVCCRCNEEPAQVARKRGLLGLIADMLA